MLNTRGEHKKSALILRKLRVYIFLLIKTNIISFAVYIAVFLRPSDDKVTSSGTNVDSYEYKKRIKYFNMHATLVTKSFFAPYMSEQKILNH